MAGTTFHLDHLIAESIYILREAVAGARNPVMLFSAGKDSTVMAHLALRAFYPAVPPFPLLHIDSTWEFRELLDFRDRFAARHGFRLIVAANAAGRAEGINPFDHGDHYTRVMRTEPLKQALDGGGYDIVFGGARRDEEQARAKERIFSVRDAGHAWNPRAQRPELWRLFNTALLPSQSLRVFPLSNWTETDIWLYALSNRLELAPLYFSTVRPVVDRDGALIAVDEPDRMHWRPGERPALRTVRFRTLGCWPVTGAIESDAADLRTVMVETQAARMSERQGRVSDGAESSSLEQKKLEGYF